MPTERLRIRPAEGTWVIRAGDAVLGETSRALEVEEENSLPVIYFPREDIGMEFFDRSETVATDPFKGNSTYYSIVTPDGVITDACWSFETPKHGAERIAGYVAFYPSRVTLEQL